MSFRADQNPRLQSQSDAEPIVSTVPLMRRRMGAEKRGLETFAGHPNASFEGKEERLEAGERCPGSPSAGEAQGAAFRSILKCIMWQCGYAGLRVGEASHPGPLACPGCGEAMRSIKLSKSQPCALCGVAAKRSGLRCEACAGILCSDCAHDAEVV